MSLAVWLGYSNVGGKAEPFSGELPMRQKKLF